MSTTVPAWWPAAHTDGPYFLIDGWPDDGIQERASVPAEAVRGPEYAEVRASGGLEAACIEFLRRCSFGEGAEMVALLESDGNALHLTLPTRWHRPLANPDEHGEYVAIDEEGCPGCNGKGTWSDADDVEEPCDECNGTGRYRMHYEEGCPWEVCNADATGAVEFYELEVGDAV